MSIYAFSQALRDHSITRLINNTQNILNRTAKSLRPRELSKSKTSFTITPEDIKMVLGRMKPLKVGEVLSDEEIQIRLNYAKNAFEARSKNNLPVKTDTNDKGITRLIFNNIYFNNPENINNSIQEVIDDIFGLDYELVKDQFQKGHVRSLATASLGKVTEKVKASTNIDETVKEFSKLLDNIVKHLEKLDKDSSNLPEVYSDLVVNSTKRYDKHMVEIQLKKENTESGGIVGTITGPLRNFVDIKVHENYTNSFNALYKALETTNAPKEIMEVLIKKRGSPSFLELLELRLLYELDPKNHKFDGKTYNLKNVPAGSLRLFKPDKASIAQLQNRIRKEIANLKKLKDSLNKRSKVLRDAKGRFASVINLQALINGRLHEQIKKNMGTGDSSNVLNYRSGRFAETSKVDSVFSRAGYIEIFYNYMKRPYATFAPGGAQGSPKSRDPNLLISKSIREIATSLVTNRLRVSPI